MASSILAVEKEDEEEEEDRSQLQSFQRATETTCLFLLLLLEGCIAQLVEGAGFANFSRVQASLKPFAFLVFFKFQFIQEVLKRFNSKIQFNLTTRTLILTNDFFIKSSYLEKKILSFYSSLKFRQSFINKKDLNQVCQNSAINCHDIYDRSE